MSGESRHFSAVLANKEGNTRAFHGFIGVKPGTAPRFSAVEAYLKEKFPEDRLVSVTIELLFGNLTKNYNEESK